MKKILFLLFTAFAFIVTSCSDSNNNAGNDKLCGNGQIDSGEVCDGQEFASKTCVDYEFSEGTLTCSSDCTEITTENCSGVITEDSDIIPTDDENDADEITDAETDEDTPQTETVIVINEVVANPLDGEEDWVELKNISNATVDISGWIISDSDAENAWTIPEGTTVAAGKYIVFGKDETGENGFTFGLSKSEDSVVITSKDSAFTANTSWNTEMEEGTSWGRIPDGTGDFTIINNPTKGSENSILEENDDDVIVDEEEVTDEDIIADTDETVDSDEIISDEEQSDTDVVTTPPPIVINEVVADSETDPDWVELKNIGTEAVDITGWILKDDDDANSWTIPSTNIPAGAYVVFEKADTEDAGFTFGLGKNGDKVRLYDTSENLIDETEWTEAVAAPNSWGRIPDGTGTFSIITTPTKNTANQ